MHHIWSMTLTCFNTIFAAPGVTTFLSLLAVFIAVTQLFRNITRSFWRGWLWTFLFCKTNCVKVAVNISQYDSVQRVTWSIGLPYYFWLIIIY